MASPSLERSCSTCEKAVSIVMCQGCETSFCSKHFAKHRQELSQQFDNICKERDILLQDLNIDENIDSLLQKIDQYEQESIEIIKMNAKKARTTLRKMRNEVKDEFEICKNKLTEQLQNSRATNDFTEVDLNDWTEYLKKLRQSIEDLSTINVVHDNNIISNNKLIRVTGRTGSLPYNPQITNNHQVAIRSIEESNVSVKEKFNEVFGDIVLSSDGLIGTCSSCICIGSCMSGIGRYSSGSHKIRFRVNRKRSCYLFFGIMNAARKLAYGVPAVESFYGWWDMNYTVKNGLGDVKTIARMIKSGDEVTMKLKCESRSIQLQHHRTNTVATLLVNLSLCPFPWKIVIRLDSEDDCVEIIC